LMEFIVFIFVLKHWMVNTANLLATNNKNHFTPPAQVNMLASTPWLRTGGFCWSKVLLRTCLWWWQRAHLDWAEDTRVLLSNITCIVSMLQNRPLVNCLKLVMDTLPSVVWP